MEVMSATAPSTVVKRPSNKLSLVRSCVYRSIIGLSSPAELKIDANGNYELSYPCEEKTYKGKSLDFEELED